MGKYRWLLALPALPLLYLAVWHRQPEIRPTPPPPDRSPTPPAQDLRSDTGPTPPDRSTGRRAMAPPAASPDPALAARLGRTGTVQVTISDSRGTPLSGVPALVIPLATWRWLKAHPDRPARYLANLVHRPAPTIPLTDARGRARVENLAVNTDLVLVSGGSGWTTGATLPFRSGSGTTPASASISLYRKSTLTIRALSAAGAALPILRAQVTPAGTTRVPPRVFTPTGTRSTRLLTCPSLPAGVPCLVEVTVLGAKGPTLLRDRIRLDPDRPTILEVKEKG